MTTWVHYQQEQLPQIFFEMAQIDALLNRHHLLSDTEFVGLVRQKIAENGIPDLAPLEFPPPNIADYMMGLKILNRPDGGTTYLSLNKAFCSLLVSALIFWIIP